MTPGRAEARTARWPGWSFAPVFLIFGVIAAAGLAPISLPAATLAGLAGAIALAARAGSAWQAGAAFWLFGVGYFGLGLRWIVEPFQIESDIYGWLAPFAAVGMAAGLALFWAAAGWGGYRLARSAEARAAAFVVTLGLAELARAHVLTGFPWAGFAQVWVDAPQRLYLASIGPQGLGLLTLALAGLPAMLTRGAVPALVAALFAFYGGAWVLAERLPETAALSKQTVRLVQPNAPQDEKWHPEKWETFFWRQIDATAAGAPPDLVVWPEAAIPQLLDEAGEVTAIMADAARGAPLAFGVNRAEGGAYFNALAVLGPEGGIEAVYDKHHLVPFGEYMPAPGLFRRLGIAALAQRAEGGFTGGPGPVLIRMAGLTVLPMICYETVFPRYARTADARPDLLLQVTNDAWFGTAAGPQQHLAQARMRATEQGLPLARAANTGISAMIDPWGRLTAFLPLGEPGHVDAPLPRAARPTLYARTGDWPTTGLLAAAALLLVGWRARASLSR